MAPIKSALTYLEKKTDKIYEKIGKFLDNHPTTYKAVLIASHLFRMISMYALMTWIPLTAPLAAVAMIGGTLLYRASVERFCCFRFTIPAMAGAGALWLAQAATTNFISGAALLSVSSTIANTLAFTPILGYAIWIIIQSHNDIEKKMQENGPCCRNI